jgi:hypothetical protein
VNPTVTRTASDAQALRPAHQHELPKPLRRPDHRPGWAWPLLALLLGLAALGQWAWLERGWLIQQPDLRPWLELACNRWSCQLPQRRDLGQIQVLQRRLQRLEDQPQALALHITLVNRADFAQPYPFIQLRLYGPASRLAGQRLFSPAEYLENQPQPAPLLQPGRPQSLQLRLYDPNADISGFEFDFL